MSNKLAVLLPYHNNLSGLTLTLESLLQESEIFTLFIFDDGSDDNDKVKEIIEKFSKKIEIIYNRSEQNLGITKTLNNALNQIKSLKEYYLIAKLHAGDLCLDNRLKTQKQFLDQERDVYLVGSWVRFVNMQRKILFIFKPPSNNKSIKKAMHLYNPFIHPSVMFRIEVVNQIGYYPENYPALEDHAYFFKIIKKFKVHIISKILLEYEINPQSISLSQRRTQTLSRIKLLLHEYSFGVNQSLGLIRAIITSLIPIKILTWFKSNLFYN